MAAKRRSKMYKQVNTFTKNMGSSGDQVLLGYIQKIDNVGVSGYCNNLTITAIVNNYDGGDETPGIICYGSTGASWTDNNVFVARGINTGGTVSLPIKRRIVLDAAETNSDEGRVYVYAELTDITVTDDISMRFVIETWGRFIEFTEA